MVAKADLFALKELNERLLDANYSLLLRLIDLARKAGVPIDSDTLGLVASTRKLLGQISDESYHRQHSDGELPEPQKARLK